MDICMDGIAINQQANGIVINSKDPLYVFANRLNFDFVYVNQFDNHYLNNSDLHEVVLEEDGILIISTVEVIRNKYFTNISLIVDIDLDNLTIINLFKIINESITNSSWKFEAINHDELYDKTGNYYNTVFVACRKKSDKQLPFDISLFYQVKDMVEKAMKESLNQLDFSL